MTILEPDLAKVLTRKVVHIYPRNLLVKFENFFWTSTPWVIATLVHYPESVFDILFTSFSHISHHWSFLLMAEGKMCHPPPVLNWEIVAFPASSYGHFCVAQFSEFLEWTLGDLHTFSQSLSWDLIRQWRSCALLSHLSPGIIWKSYWKTSCKI